MPCKVNMKTFCCLKEKKTNKTALNVHLKNSVSLLTNTQVRETVVTVLKKFL